MATSLLGLTGHPHSGADTAAAHLVAAHGHTRLGLSDPVREILLAVDPLVEGTRRRARDDDSGTVPKKALDESQRLINAFSREISRRGLLADPQDGRIRPATKAARLLDPFCVPAHRNAVADRLSAHLTAVNGDWSRLSDPAVPAHREIHRLHRLLRTDAGPQIDQFGPDLWVRLALTAAAAIDGPVVVDDVRSDQEARAIRESGGTVIRIHRPAPNTAGNTHSSGAGVSQHLIDTTVVDDGTPQQLRTLVDAVVGSSALAA